MSGPAAARVLADTHVLLWLLGEPHRIPVATRDLLRDRSTDLWVSAVTAWEVATKHRVGKLPSAVPVVAAYDSYLSRLGARELAVTARHALLAGSMTWEHRDPFDRMLAAQAMIESVPLVTADAAFRTLPGLHVLWS